MTCKVSASASPKKVIFSPHARHNMGLMVPLLLFQASTSGWLKQVYILGCKLKTKNIKILEYFLQYFSNHTLWRNVHIL